LVDELAHIQGVVGTFFDQQHFMAAALHDLPVFDHQHLVGVAVSGVCVGFNAAEAEFTNKNTPIPAQTAIAISKANIRFFISPLPLWLVDCDCYISCFCMPV
jgi:hypothetical protein